MQKIYTSIEELIKKELNNNEDSTTLILINSLSKVGTRGYFNKEEFMWMAMWKSPRPKPHYLKNSNSKIISISKKVLSTKFEKRRIELLLELNGVLIPTASAILTLIDPKNYGVIDIRVWQVLYLYGSVKNKPEATNLDFNNWYNYLMKLRFYAKKFEASVRDIERTIFIHHNTFRKATFTNHNIVSHLLLGGPSFMVGSCVKQGDPLLAAWS